MSDLTPDSQRQLAIRIAASANEADKEALKQWLEGLLTLKARSIAPVEKAKEALALTGQNGGSRIEAVGLG